MSPVPATPRSPRSAHPLTAWAPATGPVHAALVAAVSAAAAVRPTSLARAANRTADEANATAREANALSPDANTIALQARDFAARGDERELS
jgi:hypothetical protein